MEDDRPPIEDIKNEKDSPRRESSLFSQLLDRLKQPSEDEEADSEVQTDKLKPSGRLERFFGKLFRQTVTPPNNLEKPSVDTDPTPAAALIEGKPAPENSQEEVVDGETGLNGSDLPSDSNVGLDEVFFDDANQQLRVDNDIQEIEIPQASPELSVRGDNEPHAPNPKNNVQEFSKVMPEPAVVYERNAAAVEVSNNIAQPAISAETTQGNVNKRNRQGTAALTVLLGAEFWARRRADREIRRDIKKVRQEQKRSFQRTNNIEASLVSRAKTADKTTPLASIDMSPGPKRPNIIFNTLEKIKEAPLSHDPENESTSLENLKPSPVSIERLVQSPPLFEQKAETTSPTVETQVVRLTERHEEIGAREERKASISSPEKVLRAVAEAAEKNVPLEKDYERRHEVKDVPTRVTTGIASVGAILTGMGVNSSTPHPQSPASSITKPNTTEQKYDKPKPQSPVTYQQAVRTGFWSAIAVIVFIIVIGLYRN